MGLGELRPAHAVASILEGVCPADGAKLVPDGMMARCPDCAAVCRGRTSPHGPEASMSTDSETWIWQLLGDGAFIERI